MLPRWHFLLGVIFIALILIIAPGTPIIYLALIFFGAFLIDFDHYMASILKTKKLRLRHAFEYHRKEKIKEQRDIAKGIKRKSDFHIFHTVEFHVLVGLFGIFWLSFFYIFVGMVFHSLLDLIDLVNRKAFHRREYFFFNWARKRAR